MFGAQTFFQIIKMSKHFWGFKALTGAYKSLLEPNRIPLVTKIEMHAPRFLFNDTEVFLLDLLK